MVQRNGKYRPIAQVLIQTGLRRGICAHVLGVSPATLSDWVKQGGWGVPRNFHLKGMHSDVGSFTRYRFRALTGYLFYLMHTRIGGYIHQQFVCGDETIVRALQFIVAQRLFAEVFVRELAPFTDGTVPKEITASHLCTFVMYVEGHLIKIGTCTDCGVAVPEHLRKTAPFYFCRCHKPSREKEYWDRFNSRMFDELFPKFEMGEIAGEVHIEMELQKTLQEIALEVVYLTKKSA